MSVNDESQTNDLELALETPELPEKYRGKSVEDVVKMHQEAEREKSRLANEVGSYRTMADELLGLQRSQRADKAREERKPITTDDLLTDPNEAIEKAITDNPGVRAAREEAVALRNELRQERFEKAYPNYQKDLSDPEFEGFIKANKTRTALAINANKGDYESAQELWELWNERKEVLKEVTESKKTVRKAQEKAGILEGAHPGGGETDKTYSRTEMIELQRKAQNGDRVARAKWNDPAYQNARMAAYAEGRVK